jgi:hypothetical protein
MYENRFLQLLSLLLLLQGVFTGGDFGLRNYPPSVLFDLLHDVANFHAIPPLQNELSQVVPPLATYPASSR